MKVIILEIVPASLNPSFNDLFGIAEDVGIVRFKYRATSLVVKEVPLFREFGAEIKIRVYAPHLSAPGTMIFNGIILEPKLGNNTVDGFYKDDKEGNLRVKIL